MNRDFSKYDHLDTAGPDEVRAAQDELLREHLKYISTHSPYYKRLFRDRGIDAASVGIEGLASLPLTDKEALENFNDELLAVSPREIGDIVMSSGTTGKPTRMMYSDHDLRRLAYNERTAMQRLGMGPDDIALLTCTMDRCFIAGLAYYEGIRAVGAAAIRNGVNSPQSHMEVIGRMEPTVLVGVPTFLLKLGQYMKARGTDPSATRVNKLLCIGEPLRDEELRMHRLGQELEDIWKAKAFSTYASSETITTFCECEAQSGGHLHPALGIVEVLDNSGDPVAGGQTGEVVVTPLLIEGMPLVRFRTGDVSFLITDKCGCGRSTPRLGPIIGRKKQMIKVHGTTIYPPAIFSALAEIEAVSEYYVVVDSTYELSDTIEVHVSVTEAACDEEFIGAALQARLRVRPGVIIEPDDKVRARVYDPASRKPLRFFVSGG